MRQGSLHEASKFGYFCVHQIIQWMQYVDKSSSGRGAEGPYERPNFTAWEDGR
jgi:hypothetical protein